MRFLRIGAAAIRRRAAAPAPRAPVSRRPFCSASSATSSFSRSELDLYQRQTEIQSAHSNKVETVQKAQEELRENQKNALSDFSKSTSEARDAVRSTAGASVLFVSGLVGVGLASLFMMRQVAASSKKALLLSKEEAEALSKEAEALSKEAEALSKEVNDLSKKAPVSKEMADLLVKVEALMKKQDTISKREEQIIKNILIN